MQKFLSLIFSLLLVLPVFAQTEVISYDEAVKIALEQNLLIKTQENNLDIFRADKLETYGQYLPSASLFGNADQTSGRQFDLSTGRLITQTNQRLNMGLTVSMLIFNGFQRHNSVKQAQYNFQAQQNLKERTKQQVVFLTTQRYLQILVDEELVKIAAQNVAEQQALRERLKEFSDVGTVPVTDYYTQDAEVKRLEMVLLEAQNNLLADKAMFSQLLQLNHSREFKLEEPEWIDNQQYNNYQLDSLYETAIQNRADYKQHNLLVASQKMNIRRATSRLYPTLSAYYNIGTGYSSSYFREDSLTKEYHLVPFRDQLMTDLVYNSVGLNLNIPLFNNFSTRSQIIRTKKLQENQELVVEDLKRTIFTEVQAAYLDYNAMKQRYQAAVVSKNAADLAFEAQKERFSVGLGNLLEYNAANTAFVRGQSELVQARYSLMFQHVIMDFYTGTVQVTGM